MASRKRTQSHVFVTDCFARRRALRDPVCRAVIEARHGTLCSCRWQGKGLQEKGMDAETGRELIVVSPMYLRPAEVESLLGDARKAKKLLGWQPTVSFYVRGLAAMRDTSRSSIEETTVLLPGFWRQPRTTERRQKLAVSYRALVASALGIAFLERSGSTGDWLTVEYGALGMNERAPAYCPATAADARLCSRVNVSERLRSWQGYRTRVST